MYALGHGPFVGRLDYVEGDAAGRSQSIHLACRTSSTRLEILRIEEPPTLHWESYMATLSIYLESGCLCKDESGTGVNPTKSRSQITIRDWDQEPDQMIGCAA